MIELLLRRLALGFVTVWLVSVIIFAGVEMLPGDACTAVLERDAQHLGQSSAGNKRQPQRQKGSFHAVTGCPLRAGAPFRSRTVLTI